MEMLSEIKRSVIRLLVSRDKTVTFYRILSVKHCIRWAICLAWQENCGEERNGLWEDGTWRIVGKLAYQPTNAILKDYDIDWLMPFDDDTGEVDNNELIIGSLSDLKTALRWWMDSYRRAIYEPEEVAA